MLEREPDWRKLVGFGFLEMLAPATCGMRTISIYGIEEKQTLSPESLLPNRFLSEAFESWLYNMWTKYVGEVTA